MYYVYVYITDQSNRYNNIQDEILYCLIALNWSKYLD